MGHAHKASELRRIGHENSTFLEGHVLEQDPNYTVTRPSRWIYDVHATSELFLTCGSVSLSAFLNFGIQMDCPDRNNRRGDDGRD
jgi:hypothetical protein